VCSKAFSTNVPFIHKKVGVLPVARDLEHDFDSGSSHEVSVPGPETKPDPWKDLVKKADLYMTKKTVVANKNKEFEDNHTFLVQLKFLPHPFSNKNADIKQLPPIEVWFELDQNDRCDKSSVTLVSCEQESNLFLALPDKEADIKYTITRARVLDDSQQSFKDFVEQCQVDLSDEKPIRVPNSFQLEIDGQKVDYMYQTMVYRRQIDLKYQNFILQLSSIEGGIFGGRKQEATLVLDYPEGGSTLDKQQLREFVVNSLNFLQSL
jgi:hypothetical protein